MLPVTAALASLACEGAILNLSRFTAHEADARTVKDDQTLRKP